MVTGDRDHRRSLLDGIRNIRRLSENYVLTQKGKARQRQVVALEIEKKVKQVGKLSEQKLSLFETGGGVNEVLSLEKRIHYLMDETFAEIDLHIQVQQNALHDKGLLFQKTLSSSLWQGGLGLFATLTLSIVVGLLVGRMVLKPLYGLQEGSEYFRTTPLKAPLKMLEWTPCFTH